MGAERKKKAGPSRYPSLTGSSAGWWVLQSWAGSKNTAPKGVLWAPLHLQAFCLVQNQATV